MREILFRAKAVNRDPDANYRTEYQNGDWVYGWLTSPPNPYCPDKIPAKMRNTDGVSGIDVDFDTVGQYTGLMDKNGVKIFEGDIVSLGGVNYPVIYNTLGNFSEFALTDGVPFGFDCVHVPMEVVSNVYDNPELLND